MEEATGRKVVAFMSQVSFDPDIAAEFFVLEPEPLDEADGTGGLASATSDGADLDAASASTWR